MSKTDSPFTRVKEGLKEAVEKHLGLTLFIAGDVLSAPSNQLCELFPIRHGGVLME
jgi:hypothetical protein